MNGQWSNTCALCYNSRYVGEDLFTKQPIECPWCKAVRLKYGNYFYPINKTNQHLFIGNTMKKQINPPFDGSEPCPMCPMEIRNLAAVAHNACNRMEEYLAYPDSGSMQRLVNEMSELKSAVAEAEPFSDAHFADRMHSHGETNRG